MATARRYALSHACNQKCICCPSTARSPAHTLYAIVAACNSGRTRDGISPSLYDEARAAAWPHGGNGGAGPGHGGRPAPLASIAEASRAEAGPALGDAAPGTQPSQQQSAHMPGAPALAPHHRVQAAAGAQANPVSGGARELLRQQDPISCQGQEQERPTAVHSQATSDVSNQDQGQSGAHPVDCIGEADSWSSAEPYCDALEEQQPPADEVVELSGDDSSIVLSDSHAAMQHVGTMAGRAQAPDEDNAVSSRGQGDEKASPTLQSQLENTEASANPLKEIPIFAAVTEMVSTCSASAALTCMHLSGLAKGKVDNDYPDVSCRCQNSSSWMYTNRLFSSTAWRCGLRRGPVEMSSLPPSTQECLKRC